LRVINDIFFPLRVDRDSVEQLLHCSLAALLFSDDGSDRPPSHRQWDWSVYCGGCGGSCLVSRILPNGKNIERCFAVSSVLTAFRLLAAKLPSNVFDVQDYYSYCGNFGRGNVAYVVRGVFFRRVSANYSCSNRLCCWMHQWHPLIYPTWVMKAELASD
jgi:hypothetical protein